MPTPIPHIEIRNPKYSAEQSPLDAICGDIETILYGRQVQFESNPGEVSITYTWRRDRWHHHMTVRHSHDDTNTFIIEYYASLQFWFFRVLGDERMSEFAELVPLLDELSLAAA